MKSIETRKRGPVHNDSIEFLLSVQKDKISISSQEETVTFHDIKMVQDISYNVCLPLENELITAVNVSVGNAQKSNITLKVIYGIIALFVIDFFIYFYFRLKGKRREQSLLEEDQPLEDADSQHALTKASIKLFGEFRVYDKHGTDITKKFSPMLRELFCLLLCHYQEGGISIRVLNNILWYDKDKHSARNNRSVYLARLKKILENVGDYSIAKNGDFLSLESDEINIDYYDFINIVASDDKSLANVESLLDIIKNGSFLQTCEYTWLDNTKSNVSDAVVSYLENFLLTFNIKDNPELVINACNAIFLFDSLDEVALRYKCRAYKEMGNHTLAKQLYANFTKEYSELYHEDFNKSFIEIMTD
jgi:DNA-binding SARP family transcriptional activator